MPDLSFYSKPFEQAGDSHWNKLAFLQHIKWNPLGIQRRGRKTHFREEKVSFGYPGTSLESNSRLVFLLWPCRDQGEYGLLDTMTNDSLLLSSESFCRPLGLHHVYDAFALNAKANVRQDALLQFQLEEAELTSDLRLTAAAVGRKMWSSSMT